MWFRRRNRKQTLKASKRKSRIWAVLRSLDGRQVAVVAGLFAVAVFLSWSVLALLDRPVRRVEVTGQFLRVSPLQIEQAVLAYSKAGIHDSRGFVSLNLRALQANL